MEGLGLLIFLKVEETTPIHPLIGGYQVHSCYHGNHVPIGVSGLDKHGCHDISRILSVMLCTCLLKEVHLNNIKLMICKFKANVLYACTHNFLYALSLLWSLVFVDQQPTVKAFVPKI